MIFKEVSSYQSKYGWVLRENVAGEETKYSEARISPRISWPFSWHRFYLKLLPGTWYNSTECFMI